jgi:hypothetical protein
MVTRTSIEERGRQIQERIAEGVRVPSADAMRNSGARRTPEKRALLEFLRQQAQRLGLQGFTAKY